MSSAEKIRVGIKYCGHCNPQIDGPDMIENAKTGDMVFVPFDDPNMDLLLIISGCLSNCVTRPVFDGPTLEIAGNSLNNWALPARDIPKKILAEINKFRQSMPDQICRRKKMMNQWNNFQGKVALVTGSTKGIGRGILEGLAQAGADVVVVSRSQEDCDRVAEEVKQYGQDVLPVAADLTSLDAINNLVEKVVQHYGRIDILVNNAGSAIGKKAEDLTEADWDHVQNIDLKAVFFCSQVVGRQMIIQKSGKIINVASVLGLVGDRQVLPYCAAKGGVIQMTKALALEWAKHNIQVNALCPGYVITSINQEALKDEKFLNHVTRKIPMRRLGEVDEMVGALLYMASNASSYMTGQSLVVDGGYTAE